MSEAKNPLPSLDPHNSEAILDSGAAAASGDAEATLDSGPAADSSTSRDLGSIGPYRLVKKLGEGGMGQVWLAEQTPPVKRRVALKVIKAGRYDDSALQRFDLERQTLAIMEHPAIAKVFDAGATADGQPYFVMEYVPGLPITQYCDQKRLTPRERLDLIVKVCEGVQHAHQKAIIHRDLKPSNILVVEVDGKPVPRVIDFGVAKATSQQSDDQTMFTQAGGMVGTPGYMSPEQADPSVLDVDTRTDVYSLGVVLYELLTGFLPFDPKQWQTKPFHEVLRQLREDDPPRPSTKVNVDRETSTAIAEKRNTGPQQLVSLLRGDLDWITLKALEKDRARRYGTPSELAADIGRYLNHEPVVARPASTAYRVRKYVQRHKVGVSAVTAMALLLVAFAVVQAVQVRRVTQERDRVTHERDRANRITSFMTGMFKVSNPSEARGNSITAREILDKASKDIETNLGKDPDVQAQMMNVMGTVYDNLGLYARAEPLLTRSLDIRRRVLGQQNPDTLKSMNDLSWVLQEQGHSAEAEKLLRETLDINRRVLGPKHKNTLLSMIELGHTLVWEGRYAEAEKLLRETLDLSRQVLGPDHSYTLASMCQLAFALEHEEGHYAEAEKLFREGLEGYRRVLGPEHPDTLESMHGLASLLGLEGHYAEAEKLFRETLDINRRVLGAEHPFTLATMNDLADDLEQEGQYDEAEKLFRENLDVSRRVLGPENPLTAMSTYNLGGIALHKGNRGEALALLREAVDHGLPPKGSLDMDKDPDLKSLHGDPRFAALVAHAKERAAAAAKKQ